MITAYFPFQVEIVEGKKYAWCKCGLSKKQVRLTNLIIPCIMYEFQVGVSIQKILIIIVIYMVIGKSQRLTALKD